MLYGGKGEREEARWGDKRLLYLVGENTNILDMVAWSLLAAVRRNSKVKKEKISRVENSKKNLPAAIKLDRNGGLRPFFASCAPASLTALAHPLSIGSIPKMLEPYSQLPALLHPPILHGLSPPCHFPPYDTNACTRQVQRTLLRLGITKNSELAQPICRNRGQVEYACTAEIPKSCVYCP